MAERDRPESPKGDPDQGFFRRWSRRKAEAQSTAAATEDPSGPAERAPASEHQAVQPRQGPAAPVDPEDLPDIESLDANSDFTVFMRPGVPEHLRTSALRKLWRSDPVFSKLDGLVEYGEDFSIASWPKGAVKTAYQVGRGFLEQINEEDERAEPKQIGEDAEQPDRPPGEPAAKPADQPAPDATAAVEPLPPELPSVREAGPSHRTPARPVAKRRRGPRAGS